jgi:predicted phosphodiesterase
MALGLTLAGGLLMTACSSRRTGAEGKVEGKKESKNLRFVVYGDTRDGHDVHRKIVGLIMKQDPGMVFQTGDLVHNGNNESQWKIYDDITGEMRKKMLVYPVRGNHDFGGAYYAERFTSPFTNGSKDYYSLDKEKCHFIVLDVDEHAEFSPNSDQYKWLIKDLDAVKGKARHVFVFFHVPPYSIGSHGMNPEVQQSLCPVFTKYGVRVVFNGHDHDYYHTTRQGVTYVVTGGGGAPLYAQDPSKGAIPGDKYEMVNHFCVVDVDGDAVTVQAIRADGTLLEKFTVAAK